MLFRKHIYIICYICMHIYIFVFTENVYINICINSKNLAWGQLMQIQGEFLLRREYRGERRGTGRASTVFLICYSFTKTKGFPGGANGKEPACQCKRHEREGSIPGVGGSPGGMHGNSLQYSCPETDAEAEGQLTGKDPDAGKDWREEEKGVTEDEMFG